MAERNGLVSDASGALLSSARVPKPCIRTIINVHKDGTILFSNSTPNALRTKARLAKAKRKWYARIRLKKCGGCTGDRDRFGRGSWRVLRQGGRAPSRVASVERVFEDRALALQRPLCETVGYARRGAANSRLVALLTAPPEGKVERVAPQWCDRARRLCTLAYSSEVPPSVVSVSLLERWKCVAQVLRLHWDYFKLISITGPHRSISRPDVLCTPKFGTCILIWTFRYLITNNAVLVNYWAFNHWNLFIPLL